ncbi:glycerol uptake facilitator-like aquaporin [Paraburkholderia sp. WC7.3g]
MTDLRSRLTAEALGTALLPAIVIGAGMMAERLAGGNVAVALLANTAATVGGLYVLIETLGPVSGAHFNPVVSAVMTVRGELPGAALVPYIVAQFRGGGKAGAGISTRGAWGAVPRKTTDVR